MLCWCVSCYIVDQQYRRGMTEEHIAVILLSSNTQIKSIWLQAATATSTRKMSAESMQIPWVIVNNMLINMSV